MPFVPRAVCVHCRVPLKPETNGVDLQATLEDGRTYYKIAADAWKCPRCGNEVYLGFGKPIEQHDPRFEQVKIDDTFYLGD